MCGKVQIKSPKSLNDDLTPEQEPSQDFVEVAQPTPPEIEDDGQAQLTSFGR